MTWQQDILCRSDPSLRYHLQHKLEELLEPQLRQPGLIDRYYLPVFLHLYEQAKYHGRPGFLAGINAPQGGGKSTLTAYLVQLFNWSGLRAVTLSIDDFYLSRAGQIHLGQTHADNPYLQQRGYPGTHDIGLGMDILTRLKHSPSGEILHLPRYDKSRYNGQGDRADPASWPSVKLPVDVVLFEGWMLGFTPLPAEHIDDPKLALVNSLLHSYAGWHQLLDSFVYLAPEDPGFVIDWRSQAEEQMKARGLPGMSAPEVRAYAEKFLPAYRLYGPGLAINPPVPGTLKIRIGKNRLPV